MTKWLLRYYGSPRHTMVQAIMSLSVVAYTAAGIGFIAPPPSAPLSFFGIAGGVAVLLLADSVMRKLTLRRVARELGAGVLQQLMNPAGSLSAFLMPMASDERHAGLPVVIRFKPSLTPSDLAEILRVTAERLEPNCG